MNFGGVPRSLWIGFTDNEAFGTTEGNFVWISGEPVTYTNWGTGEPNDGVGSLDDYAYITAFSFNQLLPGNWNDRR